MTETPDTRPRDEDGGGDAPAAPSAGRIATLVLVGLGATGMIFAALFWILDFAGVQTELPYVLVGIAGLILYNLGRLPAYVRLLFPRADPRERGPKFHRRD